ncbi:hypothetical protein TH1_04035 [Thalassospira lucentensis MCCC 1A00383 = DSM 14000]|nr:hypothetical protein TH1_04035 [Thalassospira lucentensis MCCC 1A00383 = DSM 14000]
MVPRGESNSHSLSETDFEAISNTIKSTGFPGYIFNFHVNMSVFWTDFRNERLIITNVFKTVKLQRSNIQAEFHLMGPFNFHAHRHLIG